MKLSDRLRLILARMVNQRDAYRTTARKMSRSQGILASAAMLIGKWPGPMKIAHGIYATMNSCPKPSGIVCAQCGLLIQEIRGRLQTGTDCYRGDTSR